MLQTFLNVFMYFPFRSVAQFALLALLLQVKPKISKLFSLFKRQTDDFKETLALSLLTPTFRQLLFKFEL